MTLVAEVQQTERDPTHAPQGESCPRCGCPHDLHDRFCPACGGELEAPQEVPSAETASKHTHIRCENCGAEIATDPDYRSYTCPFCDSTYVVEYSPDQTGRQPPEFVIGFAVTIHEAQERFQLWLKENAWFRPGDLASAKIEDKLRGIYLPFWSFSMLAESRWSASIGEHWYRTESYTTTVNGKSVRRTRRVQETEWWPLDGNHHRYYSGYLVTGSRGLPQREADRIKPFYLQELKRYDPYFLAGWSAEEYSVERDAALELCQQEFYQRERNNVMAFLPGDKQRSVMVDTHFSKISSDLILLPIYICSYRYGDKVYRFLLNGQTGRAAGDKPVSGKRIAGAIVGVIAALLLITLIMFLLSR